MTGQDIQRRNLFWLLHRNHHVLCQDPYPHAAAQWRFYSGQKSWPAEVFNVLSPSSDCAVKRASTLAPATASPNCGTKLGSDKRSEAGPQATSLPASIITILVAKRASSGKFGHRVADIEHRQAQFIAQPLKIA